MKSRNRGGRPTKLTLALQKEICRLLETGVYASDACQSVGVTRAAYYSWLKRGNVYLEALEEEGGTTPPKSERPYADFCLAVRKAEATVATSAVAKILEIGRSNSDWRALAWWLERRFPDEYGRRRVEVTGREGGPIRTANLHSDISAEMLGAMTEYQLSDLYARMLRDDAEAAQG